MKKRQQRIVWSSIGITGGIFLSIAILANWRLASQSSFWRLSAQQSIAETLFDTSSFIQGDSSEDIFPAMAGAFLVAKYLPSKNMPPIMARAISELAAKSMREELATEKEVLFICELIKKHLPADAIELRSHGLMARYF